MFVEESFFVEARPGVKAGACLRQAPPVSQESADGSIGLPHTPALFLVVERQPSQRTHPPGQIVQYARYRTSVAQIQIQPPQAEHLGKQLVSRVSILFSVAKNTFLIQGIS
ncbi:uncharacterized protein TNCT_544601 [Trichonephila clavata]|uniref:Uncharacterized protein n=1 Tax=Trichonephila clavata TaxID=2740835 RepID=A0A8X6L1R7_TRICU|nr:uncharacterized protein TNCT_544601 [Trichonephila clavata]